MALSRERTLQLLQESLSHIQRNGLLDHEVVLDDQMVLLGSGSVLDSLNFVAFISDIEERLNGEGRQDLFLVLSDIPTFDPDDPHLSVETLVRHIVSLTEGKLDSDTR